MKGSSGRRPARASRATRNASAGQRKPLDDKDLPFLLEATRLLARSMDIEATLQTVARLSLPHLGSWCVVDLCEGDHMRRLAIIHPDPAQQPLADQLLAGWPPQRDDPLGIPSVVRTGRSEIVSPVTGQMLTLAARSPENLAILRALAIGSFMSVPLLARGRVLGAITYLSPNHGDSFSHRELALAEDLATRCAIAIDNARLLDSARVAQNAAEVAQERAERANLIKMRFLSTMSHELRTPLNAIAGYGELLGMGLRGRLNDAQLADVRRIQANQRHMLALVESVLSYAKIDAGRIEFGLEDLSLAMLLADVRGIIAPFAEEMEVTCLGFDVGEDVGVTVYADAEKLSQILVNLLTNAIKFSEEGDTVEIAHRTVGTNVQLSVADHGIGIAPAQVERIFEPFVQVEDGSSRRRAGTGLGLAISRELALGMGGCLTVESEVGRGSTFVLTLPQGRG